MLKKIVRLGGILCLIGLITTLLLAAANYVTKPIIEENTKNNENLSRRSLVEAEEFNPIDEDETVYEGTTNGETQGYCVNVETAGYSTGLKLIVGFDKDLAVTGIKVIESSETPGLGANASKPEFSESLKGKKAPIKAKKGGNAGDDEFDALSGATRTSEGVEKGINEAYEKVLVATGEKEEKND